ncbi:hypothetical protein B0T26DRAFT_103619 [Lasiosphaeria miniovina]|uniref:Uncharacterized protein n=1 Tax=Lasiosphaeria miniovina TaxID=1954250 RepID=A0AA40B353_9PEZI|nr:uncharacterized protein B0T26DRAFT_103619 [Lasiosphaeria miniovina]KAK0726779.1 hypothetical protein B0T26DRAFT_103619 [Lasiosphaeria miniovina]
MRRGVRLTEDVPPCCPLRTERPVGSSSSSSVHTPAATRSSSLSSPRISHPSPAPVSSLMQPPATQDAAELTVAAWGDSASGDRGDGAMDIDMFVPSFWDDPENNGYFLASPMDAVGGVYDGQFGMKYSEQCTTPIPGSMGSAEYQDVCSPPSAAGFSSVVSGGDDDRHGKDGHPVGSYDGDNGLGWPLDPLLIPDMSRSRSDSNISNGAAGSARTQQQPARHGSISAGSALSAHARTGTPTPSLASVAAGGFGLGSRTSRPSINTEVHASHYQQPSSSVSAGAGSGANSPRSRMTIVVDEAKPETLVEVMKVLMESQARVEFRRG